MSTSDEMIAQHERELAELQGKTDNYSLRRVDELRAVIATVRLFRPKRGN